MAPVAKKRKVEQVEEITFDPEARQEYLTGFHKRKQQRIENARDAATKREKEERVKERKQIREQRKEDLSRHIAQVNEELRKQNQDLDDSEDAGDADGEMEEWGGIEDAEEDVAQDEEFVDEDKYTTVTVEAMADPRAESEDDGEAERKAKAAGANGETVPKNRISGKDGKAKPKKRKFRYESKAERQVTRQKQKSKNHAAKVRRKGK